MGGVNLAIKSESENYDRKVFMERVLGKGYENKPCVFLSHQKNDTKDCRYVAEYLKSANFNIYFDEEDNDLRIHREENNPKGVTNSILKGINKSSHMLCIMSSHTLDSMWVPFEIGYGYGKISLGVLTLKGISDNEIPAYAKTPDILLRGIKSLNRYIASISSESEPILESKKLIKSFSVPSHPLENILDMNL